MDSLMNKKPDINPDNAGQKSGQDVQTVVNLAHRLEQAVARLAELEAEKRAWEMERQLLLEQRTNDELRRAIEDLRAKLEEKEREIKEKEKEEEKVVSLSLAKEKLRSAPKTPPTEVTIELIQRKIARHFGIPLKLITGKTRKQEVAEARHVAMYLTKKLTDKPLKAIGFHFGGRDHSTVIHACQLIETRIEAEPGFADLVESLSKAILVAS